jgi:group I intron endonuclease
MKNTGIIYMATNKTNSKAYVGQTVYSLKIRKSGHKNDSKRGSSKFNNAIKKYRIDGFTWEILHNNVPISHLDYLEQYEICMRGTYEFGYNTTIGGDVNPMIGKTHKQESIDKIIKSLTGHKCSCETREKMRKAGLKRRHSEKTKNKISKNHADVGGENNPMCGKSLYEHWLEKYDKAEADKRSKVHKKKISEANKGKWLAENGTASKLTWEIVKDIRDCYKSGKYTQKMLADKYNISTANVCLIVNRRTWR